MNLNNKPRVQVDRWPVSDLPGSPYVLSIIVVGFYDRKPTVAIIEQALIVAIGEIKTTEGKANAAPYMKG